MISSTGVKGCLGSKIDCLNRRYMKNGEIGNGLRKHNIFVCAVLLFFASDHVELCSRFSCIHRSTRSKTSELRVSSGSGSIQDRRRSLISRPLLITPKRAKTSGRVVYVLVFLCYVLVWRRGRKVVLFG